MSQKELQFYCNSFFMLIHKCILPVEENKIKSVTIFSNIGSIVYHQEIVMHQKAIQVNTKNLASGMYSVVANSAKEKYTSKLVVRH